MFSKKLINFISVHVPTNVFDEGPEATEFIQWSEILDEVFTQNYQSDPVSYLI